MKRTLILLTLFFFTHLSSAQVFGDISTDQRKISKDIEYTIPYSKPGKLVFDIAVDMDGNITSCTIDEKKSTITHTGAIMRAKNKIMTYLKFERGYHWPEFHRGFVLIKTVQTDVKENNKFAPPPH